MRALACLTLTLSLFACGNSAITTTDDLPASVDDLTTAATQDLTQAALNDLTGVVQDLTAAPGDLSAATVDMTMTAPPDLAAQPDLTAPLNDLTGVVQDFTAVPPDLILRDMTMAPRDMTIPRDMLRPGDFTMNGIQCGTMTCQVGQKCCVMNQGMTTTTTCASSCPDSNITVACDGPEDCMGNPCCATIMGGTPGNPTCTMAQNACFPAVSFGGDGQSRLCHVNADCTSGAMGTSLNLCCTIMQNNTPVHVCLNQAFASFVGGTCP